MEQSGTASLVLSCHVVRSRKASVLVSLIIFILSYFFVSIELFAKVNTGQQPNTQAGSAVWQNKLFPQPKGISPAVQFWTKVYTQISTSEGYLHDNVNLGIIYETIKLPKGLSYKARARYSKKIKKKYKRILDKLIKLKRASKPIKISQLSKEEKRVLALWPKTVTAKELRRAKKRIRFQLGQADKFRAGLVRSGKWRPYIISVLKKMNLPLEIATLPHVESSFNHKAYSKVGAAGMWQFTRSTGRRYMQIDQVLDERLDPFLATVAAARLLQNNYAVTDTWPLALTAYNHGAAGMRRAARKVATTDIDVIIQKYKSRSFGFASRNFYPSFLAALSIAKQPEKYFNNIKLAAPADYEVFKMTDYMKISTVIKALNISREDLMAANPALRPAVWNGNKYLPKHYELRIERSALPNVALAISELQNVAANERFDNQKADRFHRVTKGQTLSLIAARYGISMRDLVESNNMRNKHIIRIGQVLILPQKDGQKIVLASKKKTAVKEKNPPISEPIAVAKDGIYVVKRGDSLEQIARKNELSLRQLLKLNNLSNSYMSNKKKIYPGQKLTLIKPEEISRQEKVQQETVQLAQVDNAFGQTETEVSAIVDMITPVEGSISIVEPEPESEPEANSSDVAIAEETVELLADPSDYSVSEDKSIEIQAAETLGHYAEWLQIRARDLRRLNKMKYGKPVVVGKRLKLSFAKVTVEAFEAQRVLYHKALQEEFFVRNQIVGADKYRLNRGESVWKLTRKTYKIPFWLLRQYNPDLNLNHISADKIITFPKVQYREQ